MSEVATGWHVTHGSVQSHFIVVERGHLRVVRRALCGRKGSTWEPEGGRPTQRCHQCAELEAWRPA